MGKIWEKSKGRGVIIWRSQDYGMSLFHAATRRRNVFSVYAVNVLSETFATCNLAIVFRRRGIEVGTNHATVPHEMFGIFSLRLCAAA